jgi:hypothetical protein
MSTAFASVALWLRLLSAKRAGSAPSAYVCAVMRIVVSCLDALLKSWPVGSDLLH